MSISALPSDPYDLQNLQQWQAKLLLAASAEDEAAPSARFAPAPTAPRPQAAEEQVAMEGGAQQLAAGVLAALAMMQVIAPPLPSLAEAVEDGKEPDDTREDDTGQDDAAEDDAAEDDPREGGLPGGDAPGGADGR